MYISMSSRKPMSFEKRFNIRPINTMYIHMVITCNKTYTVKHNTVNYYRDKLIPPILTIPILIYVLIYLILINSNLISAV